MKDEGGRCGWRNVMKAGASAAIVQPSHPKPSYSKPTYPLMEVGINPITLDQERDPLACCQTVCNVYCSLTGIQLCTRPNFF